MNEQKQNRHQATASLSKPGKKTYANLANTPLTGPFLAPGLDICPARACDRLQWHAIETCYCLGSMGACSMEHGASAFAAAPVLFSHMPQKSHCPMSSLSICLFMRHSVVPLDPCNFLPHVSRCGLAVHDRRRGMTLKRKSKNPKLKKESPAKGPVFDSSSVLQALIPGHRTARPRPF